MAHRFLSSSHAGLSRHLNDEDNDDEQPQRPPAPWKIPIGNPRKPVRSSRSKSNVQPPFLLTKSSKSRSALDIFSEEYEESDKENNSPPESPSPTQNKLPRSVSNLSASMFRLNLGQNAFSNSMPSLHGPSTNQIFDSAPTARRAGMKTVTSQKAQEKAIAHHLSQVRGNASLPENIKPQLSHLILNNTSQPELNCVDAQTVADLISGKYEHFYDEVRILDCRFEYEFNGGHIRGAQNIPHESIVEKAFARNSNYEGRGHKVCLVFHCEFSSHRGPKSWRKLRALDRKINEHCYPNLSFPEMYLLEGGYKNFFETHPTLCDPQGYVEMKDPMFVQELKLGMRGRSKSQCRINLSKSANLPHPSLSEQPQREQQEQQPEVKEEQVPPQLNRLRSSFSLGYGACFPEMQHDENEEDEEEKKEEKQE